MQPSSNPNSQTQQKNPSRSLFEAMGGAAGLLQNVLDTIPQFVFWKDRDSVYLGCNQRFADAAGLESPDDIVGLTDFDLPWEDGEANFYRQCDARIIENGEAEFGIIETQLNADGTTKWIETNKAPLFDDNKQVVGILGSFHDISTLKLAEESLQKSNEVLEKRVAERTKKLEAASKLIREELDEKQAALAKLRELQAQLVEASRFAGMAEVATDVVHNIGNVLNSVNVSVGVIQKHFDKSSFDNLSKISTVIADHENNFAEFVQHDARGQKIPAYIRTLTKALKVERQQLEDEFQTISECVEHVKQIVSAQEEFAVRTNLTQKLTLKQVVSAAASSCKAILGIHKLEIQSEVPDKEITFRSDQHKVLQIMINLIKNSVDSVVDSEIENPSIVVRGSVNENCVEISVSDNGKGISTQDLHHIFAHGFSTKENGNGFGLHASANTAIELGGTVKGESEGPDRGANFTLSLPLETESAALA